MNKTVTVNIGGIVFHIDENAYERFKQYLESIRVHFVGSDGRDEIMQDIESRIAEMFQERIKDLKQVITISDVEEVTAIMGKPEEFGDEESKEKEVDASEIKVKRRLFRNSDDKLLGGVCSGISEYFNLDPIWIRLAFAAAFFLGGSGFLLYLILWIIIPKAVTTADKLQMKGEPITVSNIEKNVQEEMEHLKKKFSGENQNRRDGNILTRIFEAIGQVIRLIFKFIGKLIAVFFIFIGLIVVFVMFASLLAIFKVPGTHYPEVLNQIFPSGFQFGFALLAIMLVIGIPFLMLAYFGARVVFNINKSSRIFNISALGVWLAAVCVCFVLGISIAKDFSEKQSIRKEIDLVQPSSKSIHLKLNKSREDEKDYNLWDEDEWDGDLRLSLKDNVLQSKDIKLDIVESNSDSFELVQVCYARGASKKLAAEHATHISYSFNQLDSVLTFEPYFEIDKSEKYRAQKMQLILRVPKGGKVYLDNSLRGFIYDIKNVSNILDHDMLKHHWEMRENGFNCLDCDGSESTIETGKIDIGNDDGSHVQINQNGVYIQGANDEVVSIDSNGVSIHKNGRTKTIKKGDFHFHINEGKK